MQTRQNSSTGVSSEIIAYGVGQKRLHSGRQPAKRIAEHLCIMEASVIGPDACKTADKGRADWNSLRRKFVSGSEKIGWD
jgi:hypothetical protein